MHRLFHAFLAMIIAVPALAQELRVGAGITDFQVFQRNSRNEADVKIGGTAEKLEGKAIEVRLTSNGKAVRNFGWRPIANVSGTTWTAEIKGIPMGGPYQIELRAPGATPVLVRDVLVGDLWVLAGQSNMQGVGNLTDVQQPNPQVHSFDMTDQWQEAKEPLHTLVSATDRVHWPLNPNKQPERLEGEALRKYQEERKKGAGLGLPFAVEMTRRTGIPVGLVPCAHGGTSMAQWSPSLRDKGGDSLYGSMYRRFQATGGRVKGVLWYQGEADASPKAAPEFRKNFEELISAVRRDFGDADLPFYYVQLGRHINHTNQAEWNTVQEIQREVANTVRRTGVVTAVDLTLDDGIHISTPGLKRLGIRLANLATRDLFPEVKDFGKLQSGPRPMSATYNPEAPNFALIRVKYSGVNGKLESAGRVGGFTIHGDNGEVLPAIYKTELDPADGSTVLLHVQGKLPPRLAVRYGYGKDPYCNLRDAADMAAPIFGPMWVVQ